MLSRFATVLLFWIVGSVAAPRPAHSIPAAVDHAIQQVTQAELKEYISVLASDRLAGRGLGHPGNKEAETYIVGALRDAKVAPAVANYLQPVEVYSPHLGRNAALAVADTERPLVDLHAGADFLPQPESSDQSVAGPLIFVQHGISAESLGHDDYANVDARGAIVLALDGAPDTLLHSSQLSTEDKADIAAIDRKTDDARAHGAIGLLVIRSYVGDAESLFPANPSVRAASYSLYGPMHDTPLAIAVISERAVKPVREALEQRRTVTARLNPDVIAHPIVMDNILGIVEGGRLPAEVVVVGAHLDHDGLDEAGRIYNGADDNASGTAAVIAMAAAFTRAAARGARPARSVVFALWNGEEKGELGAQYYVAHPQPPRRIVANINLDMVGRDEDIPDPDDPRYHGFAKTRAADNTNVVHLLGYSYAPDLARDTEVANDTIRLTVKEDYDRDSQNLVRRSDNWPFIEHGIPAVFLTTGLHPDYHTPTDDTDRIDFAKLERITELASRLVWLAADGDTAPRFHAQ
jgi:hypothetical protein